MKRRAYFMPFRGCERRCVYCDQRSITGIDEPPSPDEIARSLSDERAPVELCYFGGSFARLPHDVMRAYLGAVRAAPAGSRVTFSTYPSDLIGERGAETLRAVAEYPIGTIELGVPSLDPYVLRACGRGDDVGEIMSAIRLLRDSGHHVGAQVMIGLPAQTTDSVVRGIETIAAEMPSGAAWHLRVYPCLVLRGTALASMYASGAYAPLSVDDAARAAGVVLLRARELGFVPIRVGLHDSPSLRESVVAGPYHPAFGELAASEMELLAMTRACPRGPWRLPRKKISLLTGHGGRGYARLAELSGASADDVRRAVIVTE